MKQLRPVMFLRRPLLRRLVAPFVGRRGFVRDEKGATAVEFSILALPFFTLIFAILETSLVFLAGQILDAAVHDASRKIRTGQAQQTLAWNLDDFRAEVCGGLYGMFECTSDDNSRMRVRVSVVSSFSNAAVEDPLDCEPDEGAEEEAEDCEWAIEETFTPGAGSEVVMVQVFYKWPTILSLPGFDLATIPGGNRMLSAVRVFSNEPF